MVDTTYDEIRRCPKCEELGALTGTKTGPNRSTIFFFTCLNPNCRWYDSAPWLRQRYADGTWVQEQPHQKFFKSVPDRTQEVQDSIDRDLGRQTQR